MGNRGSAGTINEFIRFLDEKSNKTVIFVRRKSYFNQIRFSIALRERGWRTVLVSVATPIDEEDAAFFDGVFNLDFHEFLFNLKFLEKVIVHTQGWMFDYELPVIVDYFLPDNIRHIVEMMDIQSFFIPSGAEIEYTGPLKAAWGEGVVGDHNFQLECEKHILNYADGLVFCGGDAHQRELLTKRGIDTRFVSFGSYPVQEFYPKPFIDKTLGVNDSQIELVFVGGVPPFGVSTPHEVYGDAQILGVVKILLEKCFSVHIYNNPQLYSDEELLLKYVEYYDLQSNNSSFKFLQGKKPWVLTETIKNYHFGLMLYEFDGVMVGENHFKAIVPTKFYQYIEAGLPVLVSDRFESVCEIVKKYNIGICVSNDDMCQLEDLIRSFNYHELRKNVMKSLTELSMDKQIERLIDLYGGSNSSVL